MKLRTILSDDRLYRYTLVRNWLGGEKYVAFVGLNPSTADETQDDPTIRRCVSFAKAWGYEGLVMVNLFAFRATQPDDMKKAEDPVGIGNNYHLKMVALEVDKVVACWGNHGTFQDRDKQVVKLLSNLECLAITKTGQPNHPLYLHADTSLKRYCRGGVLIPEGTPEPYVLVDP